MSMKRSGPMNTDPGDSMSQGDASRMDERIFRYVKGRATPEEQAELEAWRHESPEHEAHFRSLAGLLGIAAELHAEQERPAPPPIGELIEEKSESPAVIALPMPGGHRVRDTRRRRRLRIGLAGAMAAAAAFAGLVMFRPQQPPSRGMQLAAAEYITGDGETAVVTLGDGSVVRLAPETRLRVTPHAERREVWLDGRAFFAIAENEELPFVVETASGRARVLGTRFDLEARSREIRVVVVEGRVELSTAAGTADLTAYELSWAAEGETPNKTKVDDVLGLLDWLDTFIVFQATPLADVAREIEARFGVELRITSPDLARETVTGWSNSRTAREIVTRVCLAVNARCELSDTLVVLQPYH